MDSLNAIARKTAESTLAKNPADWQAYLLLCAVEQREKRLDKVADSDVDDNIDSFGHRYCEYAEMRGTDGGYLALQACLNVGIATFSELLATTNGEERELVIYACKKIGLMQ